MRLYTCENQSTDNHGASTSGPLWDFTTHSISTCSNGAVSGTITYTNNGIGIAGVTASKIRFWSNSTSVTVIAGETVTAHSALRLKGDLDNNGIAPDANDVALMKDASVGKITPDWRYDLNANGVYADAGDCAMLKDASVGKIVLV